MSGGIPWALTVLGSFSATRPAEAQSSVDLNYLYYQESDGRVRVLTPMLLVHQDFGEAGGMVDLRLSHDSVSGASPTGGLPTGTMTTTTSASTSGSSSSSQFPMVQFSDVRRSEALTYSHRFGAHLPSIDLSHSAEKDYFANEVGISDAWTMAGGRGTLHYGASFSHDIVEPVTNTLHLAKKTRSFALGWTWILGENDLMDLSTMWTRDQGYLDEPYLIVPVGTGTLPDHRPDSSTHQAFLLKYGHYFDWDGALKTTYRYYRDDWSIASHTLSLDYDQHAGDGWIISPSLRFYTQTAASFYGTSFDTPPVYRTADYRLSAFSNIQVGLAFSYSFSHDFLVRVGGTYQTQRGRDRILPLIQPPVEDNPAVYGGSSVSAADVNTQTITVGLKWRY